MLIVLTALIPTNNKLFWAFPVLLFPCSLAALLELNREPRPKAMYRETRQCLRTRQYSKLFLKPKVWSVSGILTECTLCAPNTPPPPTQDSAYYAVFLSISSAIDFEIFPIGLVNFVCVN